MTSRLLCGHRSKRLVSAREPLSHRIEGEVVESATGGLRTHYKDYVRGSSHAGAGNNGRLTVDGRPTRAKSRQKMMEARHFSRSEGILRCGTSRRSRNATWNRDLRESNRSAGVIESISRDFDATRAANTAKPPAGISFSGAHAVPIAEPSACHQDYTARKGAPKTWDTGYRPLASNARKAPALLNGLGVI